MKRYIVVSAVGRDRPGFVNEITHAIHRIGGNIELQRSTRMAEEFALLILFSMPGGAAEAAEAIAGMESLKTANRFVGAREAVSAPAAGKDWVRTAEIIASGADQPGIIDALTLLLFRHHVNIESMDYDVDSAPMTGEDLFRLKATVAIPREVDAEGLHARLKEMEVEYNFDMVFQYPPGS
jgi:glycine cleavage system regulatory protein